MNKGSIKDPSIALKPSSKLVEFIKTLDDPSIDLPENLLKLYRAFTKDTSDRNIRQQPIPIQSYSKEEQKLLDGLRDESKQSSSIGQCLKSLSVSFDNDEESSSDEIETLSADDSKSTGKNQARKNRAKQREKELSRLTLTLTDLKWLNQYLAKLRETDESVSYLHELIEGSKLILPKNEVIERNPELEARCQKLRREQEEQRYRMMTKNVDCSRTQDPEETISYQMKQINRQLIAVLQFIFSVLAGFAFGFIGIELITGNLDFGFRLLLGIICALIIALAEIYFLAKKLNEDLDMAEEKEQILALNKKLASQAQNPTDTKQHAD